jgi:SAM-dependent methyltransferase
LNKDSILSKEENFHDEWADAINIDNVRVDDFFEACTAPENRLIMKRLGDVRGKKILDLGCGAGEAAVYLAKKGADVTATDISAGMLDVAKKLARKHAVRVETKQCSSHSMPFPDGTFDIVYAANVLHHVDIESTAKEAHRILKRGGMFVSWDPLAYNLVIELYRRMAAKVRTADEHPLKSGDLKIFRKIFSRVDTETTWFFPLLIFVKFYLVDRVRPDTERYWKKVVLEHEKLSGMYNVLERMDRLLFAVLPFMKRYRVDTQPFWP